MAAKQTIIWTALPNGYVYNAKREKIALLSVYISPRLESDSVSGTLQEFSDFSNPASSSNWAKTVNSVDFRVEVATPLQPGGTRVYPEKRSSIAGVRRASTAQAELWDALFAPDSPVESMSSGARAAHLTTIKNNLTSYAVKPLTSAIQQQYQAIAAKPALVYKLPPPKTVINPPALRNAPLVRMLPLDVLPGSIRRMRAAAQTDDNFAAFQAFHTPFDDRVEAQSADRQRQRAQAVAGAPVAPALDFHTAVASLSDYPALMRAAGLVVDLEVPVTGDLTNAARIRVVPLWPGMAGGARQSYGSAEGATISAHDVSPWTALEASWFGPRARNKSVQEKGYMVVRSPSTNTTNDAVTIANYDYVLATNRLYATGLSAAQAQSRLEAAAAQRAQAVTGAAAAASLPSEDMGLPTLGQPLISLAVNGLADRMKANFAEAAKKEAHVQNNEDDLILNYAEDLVRGHRVDVWDSVTRKWHRLCERRGQYSVGSEPITWSKGAALLGGVGLKTFDDEGWVQPAVTSATQPTLDPAFPTSEIRLHESMFTWAGWSLAVPKPGAPLSAVDKYGNSAPMRQAPGPDGQIHDLGDYQHPDFPLGVKLSVKPGSLPRLRFGVTYRFRARTVDLAGNSVAFSAGNSDEEPGGANDTKVTVTRAITHMRYEPVKPPTVAITEALKPAEGPLHVVVRSDADTDPQSITAASRHIMPPVTSVSMAETHSGLEVATAGRPMSKALYELLAARDGWKLPVNPETEDQAPIAMIPTPLPYLPDMIARGAAFRDLPGVPKTLSVRSIGGAGARMSGTRISTGGTSTEIVNSVRVDFDSPGAAWYDKKPFMLVIKGIEATDTRLAKHATPRMPVWDATARTLTVQIPKAETVDVGLSSFMSESDLKVMGVHLWTVMKLAASVLSTTTLQPITAKNVGALAIDMKRIPTRPSAKLPKDLNSVISLATIGQDWTLTPAEPLRIVHAVKRPLIAPQFTKRVHVERSAGETFGTLIDWMPIHGKSTEKLDVSAQWYEPLDDPLQGAPKWGTTSVPHSGPALTLPVKPGDTTSLNAGRAIPLQLKVVPTKLPSVIGRVTPPTLAKTDTALPLVVTPIIIKAVLGVLPQFTQQRHHFGDTKHRRVTYTATAVSRFANYFADEDEPDTKRASAPCTVEVPSSARPEPPRIAYVIPTFGWSKTSSTSTRTGGGLRVYLERPWFTSGDDERLAVVVWQASSGASGWQALRDYVSEWGYDPLFTSVGPLASGYPSLDVFTNTSEKATGLKLLENGGWPVQAAAHEVDYDASKGLWYADLVIDSGRAYFPFIKLALARYQPYSVPGVEISPVVIADFVQLAPKRTASIVWGGNTFTVQVQGYTYGKSSFGRAALVTAQVEKAAEAADADLGWTPAGDEFTLTIPGATARTGSTAQAAEPLIVQPRPTLLPGVLTTLPTVWRSSAIPAPAWEAGTRYRVVLREYEWYEGDEAGGVKRLVYADTLTLAPSRR